MSKKSDKQAKLGRSHKDMDHSLSLQDELQRYLFHAFTIVALIFLAVYMILQARAGLFALAALCGVAALLIAINRVMIRYHNQLLIAANAFALLGPVVLIPWQVTGGMVGTGLMWFPAYVVFVMFFVPGIWGSIWVFATYSASFFVFLLQMQGVLALPFDADVMFHFYFLGGVTYALTFLFLQAQRIIVEVLHMRIAALESTKDTAEIGSWTWDVEHDEVRWSDNMYRIFGIKPGRKVTYEGYLKWVYPEDRDLTRQSVEEALEDHQLFSLIHRVKRPDGATIWLHTLGEVVLDVSGRPIQLVGTAQDITGRLAKETELLKNF